MWTVCAQNDSVLMHYGVKGMKWGVRKEYEPKEKRKGSSKKLMETGPGDYSRYDDFSKIERGRTLDSKTKTTKTKNGETKTRIDGIKSIKYYEDEIHRATAKSGSYIEEDKAKEILKNLPKLQKETSDAFEVYAVNKNGPTKERRYNCFECSMAYEMRQRGYDVQSNTRRGGIKLEYYNAFKIKDSFNVNSYSIEEAYKAISEQCLSYGEGARGAIGVSWLTGSGHSFNWYVKNGEFYFIDTQVDSDVLDEKGNVVSKGGIDEAFFSRADPSNITVVRLDNAEPSYGIVNYIEPYEGPTEKEMEEEEKKKKEEEKRYEQVKFISKAYELKLNSRTEKKRRNEIIERYKRAGKGEVERFLDDTVSFVSKAAKNASAGVRAYVRSFTNKKDTRSFGQKLFNIKPGKKKNKRKNSTITWEVH